MSIEQKGKSGN